MQSADCCIQLQVSELNAQHIAKGLFRYFNVIKKKVLQMVKK